MVKYPLWIQKLFYYTIQYEGGRHIDFRQMPVSLRQTTANNCKTAFSLQVVNSTSDDYSFWLLLLYYYYYTQCQQSTSCIKDC